MEEFAVPDLVSAAAEGHDSSAVGFDAAQLVETQSRLLQSRQLALLVVDRLGLGRLQTPSHANPFVEWLRAKLHGDVAENSQYQKDKAAATLLRGLTVRTEPRVYSIRVNYTAANPAFAALVVNTFVAEFVREIELQKLSEQQAVAKGTLSTKLEILGEKHPQVRVAQVRLAAAEDLLRTEGNKKPQEILRDAGERITVAQPDAVPSSPNPPVIIFLSRSSASRWVSAMPFTSQRGGPEGIQGKARMCQPVLSPRSPNSARRCDQDETRVSSKLGWFAKTLGTFTSCLSLPSRDREMQSLRLKTSIPHSLRFFWQGTRSSLRPLPILGWGHSMSAI